MRLSDLISDVCSSVLGRDIKRHPAPPPKPISSRPLNLRQPRRLNRRQRAIQPRVACALDPGPTQPSAVEFADRHVHEASPRRLAAEETRAVLLPWQVHRGRSEEHTSELPSLMRISYAVFCLKKKKHT